MIASSGGLLVALVIVIALQVIHRMAGSIAAIVWCGGVLVWGLDRLNSGAEIHFFGIRSDKRIFIAIMVGFALYNALLVLKELKRKKARPKPPADLA